MYVRICPTDARLYEDYLKTTNILRQARLHALAFSARNFSKVNTHFKITIVFLSESRLSLETDPGRLTSCMRYFDQAVKREPEG